VYRLRIAGVGAGLRLGRRAGFGDRGSRTYEARSPASGEGAYLSWYTAGVEKRLGELYEAKGDAQNAIPHYLKFVDLWKGADPELQPKVAEVRRKLARLRDLEGPKKR
jgi:hypothetical protein